MAGIQAGEQSSPLRGEEEGEEKGEEQEVAPTCRGEGLIMQYLEVFHTCHFTDKYHTHA